ncbi:phage/plasmid primase, P4 family, partial [Haloprofundus marisrubri]|uniref:phage/plasmid primase, P4 family n=1 Tax=Haloprofundus marisrubri TaxID=1514971 RepID=UPI00196A0748
MSEEPKQRVAKRLEEAGIDTKRFVDVKNGKKASHDHTRHEAHEVSGNYGIYATTEDRLICVDVDDYGDLDDKSGLLALAELPATFEQKSPHGGTHRFYGVEEAEDGRPIAEVFKEEFDLTKGNPGPSWGEVRAANQYVVGAGSQLDDCDKDWCDECATEEGGRYTLNADREIATIEASQIVDVLRQDPTYAPKEDEEPETPAPSSSADNSEVLAFALTESNDEKLKRLWRGDYSDYGGDRSEAECALAFKLAFWLQGDKRAVGRAMDGQLTAEGVSRPSLSKWSEREDDGYRSSVLEAVDKQTEYYTPSSEKYQAPPAPEEDEEETKSAGVETWGKIRDLYQDTEINSKFARFAAAEKLNAEGAFITPRDTQKLYSYHEPSGLFEVGGVLDVERELQRGLGPHYTQHEKREIVGQLKAQTYVDRDCLNAGEYEDDLFCVGNGVINLRTMEFSEHSPKYCFTRGLKWDYDPDAEAPNIEEFVENITDRRADELTLYEMIGNCLLPHYDFRSILVLFGRGKNGKSTFYDLVSEFLSRENISGVTMQKMAENRFATKAIVGNLANIAADMPSKKVNDLGTVKALTGSDPIDVEPKGKESYTAVNSAKLMFGANEPPVLGERTEAIQDRLYPIRFSTKFTDNPNDGNPDKVEKSTLMQQLTKEEEMSGLLNLALAGIRRLYDNGDFSMPESPEERLEYYEQYSDPIKMFRVNCLENEKGRQVSKDDVY